MRTYWIAFSLLCLSRPLFGQGFSAVSGPVLSQPVTPEMANECYIFFENPGGDTLHLRWKLVESTIPNGWTIDLCDYGACYVGIPASAAMNPVYDTIQPYLKLIVLPENISGDAWLWFRVWVDGHPAIFQDVFFSLFTPDVTAVQSPASPALRVFPNPATDVIQVENPAGRPQFMRLTDTKGALLWQGLLPAGHSHQIQLSGFSAGPLFLQTDRQTQTILHAN